MYASPVFILRSTSLKFAALCRDRLKKHTSFESCLGWPQNWGQYNEKNNFHEISLN